MVSVSFNQRRSLGTILSGLLVKYFDVRVKPARLLEKFQKIHILRGVRIADKNEKSPRLVAKFYRPSIPKDPFERFPFLLYETLLQEKDMPLEPELIELNLLEADKDLSVQQRDRNSGTKKTTQRKSAWRTERKWRDHIYQTA